MKHILHVAPIIVLIVLLNGGCDKNRRASKGLSPEKVSDAPPVTKSQPSPSPFPSVKSSPEVRTPIDAGKP